MHCPIVCLHVLIDFVAVDHATSFVIGLNSLWLQDLYEDLVEWSLPHFMLDGGTCAQSAYPHWSSRLFQ
jgi:hypothetical protein